VLAGRFIEILKSHIPETPVGYHYVAVRVLLMSKDEWGIDNADKYLRRGLTNAQDHPAMNGWWRKGITEDGKKQPAIYQCPKEPSDLIRSALRPSGLKKRGAWRTRTRTRLTTPHLKVPDPGGRRFPKKRFLSFL